MRKCLYMICPTDHLESVINSRFEGHNYFYTTLGNNVKLDKDTIGQIALLLETNSIREITFILSIDNCILLDALIKQHFRNIGGLDDFYLYLQERKKHMFNSWQRHNHYIILFSYYLNHKIKELKTGLRGVIPTQPSINGKLFSKDYNKFSPIHSDLVCLHSSNLN
ncbi:hypothetical protein [Sphingobacterium chuzhouense]|uniref:Uncharacterized protein n=1 Tax=Sphingobacterium chuzhouense TaxID=1742264 RepID=A0ABR7XP73_9SPHI|nr:hypothetical protein [Sphingobacterium chuzhouense]MBD1420973.1 hypothetical protein [Sphingobacterium chuzhouense]